MGTRIMIIIRAILMAGCGIYLWVNYVSETECSETIGGEYELIGWDLSPKNDAKTDTIVLSDIPDRGECVILQPSSDKYLQMTTKSSSPVLQRIADMKWQFQCIYDRHWFGLRHRVSAIYLDAEKRFVLRLYWERNFVGGEIDVDFLVDISEPNDENINWHLIFKKIKQD